MKLEREEQRMQQPQCSICEGRAPRVAVAQVTVSCPRFDQQIGMSRNDSHVATVRICRSCAEHIFTYLA